MADLCISQWCNVSSRMHHQLLSSARCKTCSYQRICDVQAPVYAIAEVRFNKGPQAINSFANVRPLPTVDTSNPQQGCVTPAGFLSRRGCRNSPVESLVLYSADPACLLGLNHLSLRNSICLPLTITSTLGRPGRASESSLPNCRRTTFGTAQGQFSPCGSRSATDSGRL